MVAISRILQFVSALIMVCLIGTSVSKSVAQSEVDKILAEMVEQELLYGRCTRLQPMITQCLIAANKARGYADMDNIIPQKRSAGVEKEENLRHLKNYLSMVSLGKREAPESGERK